MSIIQLEIIMNDILYLTIKYQIIFIKAFMHIHLMMFSLNICVIHLQSKKNISFCIIYFLCKFFICKYKDKASGQQMENKRNVI